MTMTNRDQADGTEVPEWTLGDRISKARRHAGLEQGDLASACGVSRPLVSLWENDKAMPRFDHVLTIAQVTNVDIGWLADAPTRTGSRTTLDMIAPFTPSALACLN